MKAYRDLIVWQKAMDAVEAVYSVTENFPKSEIFALSSQMRRASVSVPSNIAEGYRRRGDKEKAHFYAIAFGSVAELETQLELAVRLKYVDSELVSLLISNLEEISKILNTLSSK